MRPVLDRKQTLAILVILALAASLWLSAALNRAFTDALVFSKAFVDAHPVASVLAFVGLAALSAMFVLFSSIVTVPVAVYAWGQTQTLLLLPAGWFIGAMLLYFIGRRFGRRAVTYFVSAAAVDRWSRLVTLEMSLASVALLKLALPSEAPSFALGVPLPVAQVRDRSRAVRASIRRLGGLSGRGADRRAARLVRAARAGRFPGRGNGHGRHFAAPPARVARWAAPMSAIDTARASACR